jgi:3-hydroxybutyryl-CoA dehydratase
MTDTSQVITLAAGDEIDAPFRIGTPERIEWYDSGLISSGLGVLSRVGDNIHTSDDFAQQHGLPAAILDGMSSTNWCQTMLIRYFGIDYVERGELRTKFIKPIYLDVPVRPRGKVLSVEGHASGGTEYKIDVWVEDDKGTKLVDGYARVVVAPR